MHIYTRFVIAKVDCMDIQRPVFHFVRATSTVGAETRLRRLDKLSLPSLRGR